MTAAIKAALLLAALLLGAWLGYGWRDREADAQMSKVEAAQAQRQAAKLADVLRQTHRIQEAQDAEQTRRLAAEIALRRADAAGRGLHDELQATRRWLEGAHASTAFEREAASKTAAVLADLLGRCDSRRRELADFADRASGAGQTCERAADAMNAANAGGAQ